MANMSKSSSKHAPVSTYVHKGFFLRPFLKYLKPHRGRLIIALFAMIGVGFFGSFSVLLLKTPLEILFGVNKRDLQQVVQTAYPALEQAVRQSPPNPQAAQALEQLRAATQAEDNSEHAVKQNAERRLLNAIPGGPQLQEWGKAHIQPYVDAAKARKAVLEDWIRREKRKALWLFAGVLVLFTAMKGLFAYTARFQLANTLYDVSISIKEDIFRHIINLDYGFFSRRTTGFLESRISSDVERIRTILDGLISDGFQQPIMLLFYLVVLFVISAKLTFIALIGMPLAFLPLLYFARQIKKVTRRSKRKEDELNSTMEESLRNFRVVKIFGGEEFEIRKFHALNARLLTLFIQRRIARFAASPIMETIGSIAAGAVLVVGGVLVLGSPGEKPVLEASSFVIYLVVCMQFYSPLKKISRMNVNWTEARVAAGRILEMLHTESDIKEVPDAQPIQDIRSGIEFRNVCFRYVDNMVLQDVNFTIPRQKIVALVGHSGSGKSTIANLLPRLFDPASGAILFDGTDARQLKIADLRRLFGVVTQDTILFNDTVESNIAYAQKEIDHERVVQCAKAAFAHDFILNLDGGEGYQTIVGQGGQSLSGGQRQRLAIARALYRDPQVLIFDEATSSLDVESERNVQDAIENLLRGRTALIIAHRLSTIRYADEILVMKNGQIIERGRHDQLMSIQGEYHRLYKLALERKEDRPEEALVGGK